MGSPRHWKDKTYPALLPILSVNKDGVLEAQKKPLTRRGLLQRVIYALNFTQWLFHSTEIPEPSKIGETDKELAHKLARLAKMIEETADEYVTPIHCGQPFAGWGEPLPACPITIEAEAKFSERLRELAASLSKTRPRRRAAVLEKISHAFIAWWGIIYGAWEGTENRFTIETLSWEESSDLYDALCFGGCTRHTPEQVRKIIVRLIGEIKSTLPPPNPAILSMFTGYQPSGR